MSRESARRPGAARHRRVLRLGVVLVLAGLLAGLAVVVVDRREAYRPAPVGAAAPQARPGPAGVALEDLVDAIDRGDRAAAARLAPPGDATAAGRLRHVVANARALGLSEVSARYVDQLGPVQDDGSWTASVALTWQVSGIDKRPARAEVAVRFVPTADGAGALVGELGAAGERAPLWWVESLSVARRADALVAVVGPPAQARTWLRRVEVAIRVVRRVLPAWEGRVVLEVAGSASQVDRALDVPPGTYAGVAAVTAPVGDARGPGAPVHVVVNPEVVAGLRPRGVQVVTSHELAHVATDATQGALPTWLLEGFADYVALRDVDLPLTVTASRAAALVRADGVPERLPSDADLSPGAPDLDAAYELAWLACRVLVDRAGEDGLLRVYRSVQAGVPAARALRAEGLDEQRLTARWQARLRGLGS